MGQSTQDAPYRTFDAVVADVPHYESFFTVGEHRERDEALAGAHDHVAFDVLGESSGGQEIWALTIGTGAHTALFFAAPHPNEPIGSMTIDFLAHRLADDDALRSSLDYEFVLIKTADIDGTRLNQGWFDGPFTISNYAQNFYRPASYEQVEWTFPMDYEEYSFDEPLPETRLLMDVIDAHEPDFVYSLHNAGFGGCYYYLSADLPPLYDDLRRIARERDVPLDLGEPEAPWMDEFADAVYQAPSATQQYDYLAEHSDDHPTEVLDNGAGSLDYARERNPDVVELITELPYFYDPKIEAREETDRSRREVVLEGADRTEALMTFLGEQFDRVADDLPDTRLTRSVENTIELSESRIATKREWAKNTPELDAPATVAEATDERTIRPFYRLLYYGTFMRALDHAAMAGDGNTDTLAAVKTAVEDRFHAEVGTLLDDLDYRAIPIRNLVGIQAQAGLICLDYLQEFGRFE